MKYPIGIQDFKSIIHDGYVYIDKTALVYKMTHEGKTYFLSRPRRFGKSLLVSTLECYFKGERDLFEGLAMDGLEREWTVYPVFHVDFNGEDFTDGQALLRKLDVLVQQWETEYGKASSPKASIGMRFLSVLAAAHRQTGHRCVVLVDEYDKPLLDVMDTNLKTRTENGTEMLVEDYNRGILKGFYSVFKEADPHLKFVLLTGVTKFSQVSVFSGFNQPKDISMDHRYDTLCGISKEELELYFKDEMKSMALDLGISEQELKKKLKDRYDGYHFSEKMVDVFNPFSILNALDSHTLRDYWFRTGTPTYLVRLLAHTQENLNDLAGKYYPTSDFIDYKADVERPLPMIFQSGYLTVKGYDEMTETYLLDLPNNEVKQGFLTALANNYLNTPLPVTPTLVEMVHALSDGSLERLRKLLTGFFASIPYNMRRKDNERDKGRYFHYTFYLIFRLLSTYIVLTEKEQSEGRADCIIETVQAVYVFEFKLDGTAEEALAQINAKGYARPYQSDPRKVCKVGVSFSSQKGTIEEWREEMED